MLVPFALDVYDDADIFPGVFFQSYIINVVSKLALVALLGYGQYQAHFRLERHLPALGPGLEFGDVFLQKCVVVVVVYFAIDNAIISEKSHPGADACGDVIDVNEKQYRADHCTLCDTRKDRGQMDHHTLPVVL